MIQSSFWRQRSGLEKAFAILLALTLLLEFGAGGRPALLAGLVELGAAGAFLALLFRYLRHLLNVFIWRLRNRLLITYLFIGVVPVLLVLGMALLAAYIFYGQVATYMAASEIQRLQEELFAGARAVAADLAAGRPGDLDESLRRHLPARFWEARRGVELLAASQAPSWLKGEFYGLARTPEGYDLRAVVGAGSGRYLVASVNLGPSLLPAIGTTRFLGLSQTSVPRKSGIARQKGPPHVMMGEYEYEMTPVASAPPLPPPAHWADLAVNWFFTVRATDWETGSDKMPALMVVSTRPSILNLFLFSTLGEFSRLPLNLLVAVGILFLVIEAGSLLVGVRLTRTITRAVADLYEATERVNRGDFSYRIAVRSRDQLSALAESFNNMTVSLERLIAESKEKERLESELEIAREVQAQLFPKQAPSLRGLELAGLCHPARIVSGDYYDFVSFGESRVALAIGDIAGKGISAALLMASIQSAMRAQLYQGRDRAGQDGLSTAAMVAQLNRQLFESTAAQSYATFCYAVYDDAEGRLTYTNAGHLPPVIVGRDGVRRLDRGGLVLGIFPEAPYEQESVILHPGDLLVAFTDGITEPEDSYGSQFGEERLLETLERVRDRSPQEVAAAVMEAVEAWSDSPEARDDMTLLVARRL